MTDHNTVAENAVVIGENKIKLLRQPGRLLLLTVMAGAFIALGGVLSVMVGSGLTHISPMAGKIASGLAFPVGLLLIVMFGAELFTGNNAMVIPALMRRRVSLAEVVADWVLVWVGNFIGAMAVVLLVTVGTDLTSAEPLRSAIVAIAETKATGLSWWSLFFRGIGANWLVCLAVWMAAMVGTLHEKAVACWLPVAAFVILGFEHSIANMFFIPCGMMEGADVTVGQLFANLLPVTLGNIAGGAVFVGLLQSRLHLSPRLKKE